MRPEDTAPLAFRIAPWRSWLLAVVPLAVLAAVGVAITVVVGEPAAAMSILIGFIGVALLLLVPIGLGARASRWHVDAHGIGGRNNWLVYHRLAWSEIESVESWSLPGYRYLQVNGAGRRWAFWLPMFLTDMPGLRAAGEPIAHLSGAAPGLTRHGRHGRSRAAAYLRRGARTADLTGARSAVAETISDLPSAGRRGGRWPGRCQMPPALASGA